MLLNIIVPCRNDIKMAFALRQCGDVKLATGRVPAARLGQTQSYSGTPLNCENSIGNCKSLGGVSLNLTDSGVAAGLFEGRRMLMGRSGPIFGGIGGAGGGSSG